MRRLSEWTAHPLPLHRVCPSPEVLLSGQSPQGMNGPFAHLPLELETPSCITVISLPHVDLPYGTGSYLRADLYQLTSSLAAFNKEGKILLLPNKMTFIFLLFE